MVQYLKRKVKDIWFDGILNDLIYVFNVYGKSDIGDALKWLIFYLTTFRKFSDKVKSPPKVVYFNTVEIVNGVRTMVRKEVRV